MTGAMPGGLRIPLAVLLVAGVAVGVWAVVRPAPAEVPSAVAGQVVYPQADLGLVDGEGRGLVQAYCTACHSLAPIVRHAGFTEEVWASEVTKMRRKYGAPIDDATAAAITTYLQQHYSAPAPPPAGTSPDAFGPAGGSGNGG